MGSFKERLEAVAKRLNIEEKEKKLKTFDGEIGRADFWRDPLRAGRLLKERAKIEEEVKALKTLRERVAARGPAAAKGGEKEQKELEDQLSRLEMRTYLSGPYDVKDALLSLHAGQGGVEAMDWAAMLKRMYLGFAVRQGWQTTVVDETPGDEAGLKSTIVEVEGNYAYGLLKGEKGVHRLVRQSPFNADHLRQTSFAMVEVIPLLGGEQTAAFDKEEVEMETFRSSGHGGQNVQKVETAVRLRHRPTGIVVVCQAERSQAQNRQRALRLLQSKLRILREEEERQRERKLKGEYKTPGWGNQIRSYVLHPYKLVKDLRTKVESKDPETVLNGRLESFIEAELRAGL